MTNQSTS